MTLTSQKAMGEGFEARTQELTKFLNVSQEQTSYKGRLREEIERSSQNPHATLKKALEEFRNIKAYNQSLTKSSGTLRNEWGAKV